MDYQENDLPNASRANMDTTSFFNLQKMDTLLSRTINGLGIKQGFTLGSKFLGYKQKLLFM